jgi:DNA-binding response OmpR family regulator
VDGRLEDRSLLCWSSPMNTDRRESIRDSLCRLAEAHAAALQVMERTYTLLCEELALDPLDYFEPRRAESLPPASTAGPVIDRSRFSVSFRGHTCRLGNTLSFRFFARLVARPNCYVSHQELFEDVWDGPRSADAVRSVVKTLRQKLRDAGLGELATAIDGAVPGHYTLRLPR